MDAIFNLPVKVDGVSGLYSRKYKPGRSEDVRATVVTKVPDIANQVKASVEKRDLGEANGFDRAEDLEEPSSIGHAEASVGSEETLLFERAEDSEEPSSIGQAEASVGVEDHDSVDGTELPELYNAIDRLDNFGDTGMIKDERDADIYPDYETIKKEEPDDDQIDRKLPELGEINDMFDDVDAPEYVDLDYEGIAEVDGVDCFVCEEFKIRQVPKPVIVTRPLYQLFDCIVSGHIVLDADYQRDVGWDEGRAALLISSILTGYFIPPIIFNCVQKEVELHDGTEQIQHKRICIDGKQRLSSVWKFMTGQIGFFDSNKPQKKWYFCHPAEELEHPNIERNILPNAVKEFFKSQAFCCYEYDELNQDTEETMFQLVQKGIALTPAEKMRAMSSPWATIAKEFEDMYPTVINLSRQSRASGFRLILVIFAMIQQVLSVKRSSVYATPTMPYLQASTGALGKMLEDNRPIDNPLKLRLISIFDKFQTLVQLSSTELSSNRWKIDRNSAFDPSPLYLRSQDMEHGRSSSSFTPLELVATTILITIHAEKHNEEELLEDIKWMRHYLRTRVKELRLNSNCWKLTWEFVSAELNLRRAGKSPSPTFTTDELMRSVLKKRDGSAVSKPKTRAKTMATPQPSSGSRSRPRRPTPVELGERLFPNLPPRREPKRVTGEMAGFIDDEDDDDTLSEYSDLSELEEEIIRLGQPAKRTQSTRDLSTDTDELALDESMLSKSTIAVVVPQYEPNSKRLRTS